MTKGDFFRLLKKSRLLSTGERVVAREIRQGAADATTAARRLVDRGLLTSWQSSQLLLGRTQFHLGRFKLLKFRGRGAMGIVFKAQHPKLRRTVAIKVLSKSLLKNPRSVARFLREIRSTALLNHPNLVVAYDADELAGTYCLVMEYFSGKSLKALCTKHGPLPVRWSCECIRQAALGLQHVHDRGLVHRDIKPSNLLVTGRSPDDHPKVKLLDIGLARFVSETEENEGLTRDGQIVGTGNYMAPEQVAKAKDADIRADIYGLGATLFHMLTGAPPLLGPTFLQTYINRLQQEAPLISTLRNDVPPVIDFAVAKMLKPEPENRYQTPAEVAADLSAAIAGLSAGEPTWQGDWESRIPRSAPGPGANQFDSDPEFTAAAAGNAPGGTSDSSLSGDQSLCGFLDVLDATPGGSSIMRRRRRWFPGLRAIKARSSQIVRRLIAGVADRRSSEKKRRRA